MSVGYEEQPGLAAVFARQARASAQNGSPLYSDLCRTASLDLAGASRLTDLLAAWVGTRAGDLLPLRVLAAAHRLVLERQAPGLALYFPSAGGTAPRDAAGKGECYAAWVGALVDHADRLPQLLANAPQTNDPGRTAALAGALHLVAHEWHLPIRLHELGASAGLNLRADLVRVEWEGGGTGPRDSPLRLDDAWHGAPLPVLAEPEVVERSGCDLDPVDVSTSEGRLHLTSYVWPDQPDRFERLRDGLALAALAPAVVHRADLVSYLRELRPEPGTALVIAHSSTWMYLDADQRAAAHQAFADLGARATPQSPVVHVAREYLGDRIDSAFALVTRWWPAPPSHVTHRYPAGTAIQYADSTAHGLPVTWMTPRPVDVDDL